MNTLFILGWVLTGIITEIVVEKLEHDKVTLRDLILSALLGVITIPIVLFYIFITKSDKVIFDFRQKKEQ